MMIRSPTMAAHFRLCVSTAARLRERDRVLCRNRLIGRDKKSSWKRERGTHPRVKRIYFEKLNKTTPEKRVRSPVHLKLNEVVSASSLFFPRDAQRQITSFPDIKRHIWCANVHFFLIAELSSFFSRNDNTIVLPFPIRILRERGEENPL